MALVEIERLPAERAPDVIAAFVDAFRDYPVMRHVVGAAGSDDDRRLERLVEFFVMNRVWRGEPVLGIVDGDAVVAAATVTPPGTRAVPAEVASSREALWRDLGNDARGRYEELGTAWARFAVAEPHHHLNMIGVRRSHEGRGLARTLLDAVHAMSDADSGSAGVSLTTEHADNVPLYQHFGYAVIGHVKIAPDLESWTFMRPG
jgi:GNAT superfamily N-acetyltransferase